MDAEKYRFTLQFTNKSPNHMRAGVYLQRLGNKKSEFIVRAIAEYLDKHPNCETDEFISTYRRMSQSRTNLHAVILEMVKNGELQIGETSLPATDLQSDNDSIDTMLEALNGFLK